MSNYSFFCITFSYYFTIFFISQIFGKKLSCTLFFITFLLICKREIFLYFLRMCLLLYYSTDDMFVKKKKKFCSCSFKLIIYHYLRFVFNIPIFYTYVRAFYSYCFRFIFFRLTIYLLLFLTWQFIDAV